MLKTCRTTLGQQSPNCNALPRKLNFRHANRFHKAITDPNNNTTNKNKFTEKKSAKKKRENVLDMHKYITNLSSKTLSQIEVKVLSKGLTYVPSIALDKPDIDSAWHKFQRSNRLKYFFRDAADSEQHPFRKKSTWEPPPASSAIEAYLHRTKAEISNLAPLPLHHNLSLPEKKALKALSRDHTLVIKNADKGSGIVVEDTDKYIKDGLDHLSDQTIYEKIDADPTAKLSEAIRQHAKQLHHKGIIDDLTLEHISSPAGFIPRTQQLYFLKKIHKNPIAVRPIVSGCSGPTEGISQLIDLVLQPFVPKINSYIQDSSHLIRLLENTNIPTNSTLVTIDVKSLYLNIPHKDGIQAVLNRLYHQNPLSEEVPLPPNTMADLLGIVLKQNFFQFSDFVYHQVQGTAMGTKMAPAYANLFMADLEEKLLENSTVDPILWKRYIDDILCIWLG